MVEVNPNSLITFESPMHGNFKSQPEVQEALRKPNWWILHGDYCAMADEENDGLVQVKGKKVTGSLWPKKPTVVLAHGVSWDFKLPSCKGTDCRMVIPGTNRHVLVICKQDDMIKGQRQVDSSSKARIPLGMYMLILKNHAEWIQRNDGYSSWCLKCGEGGSELLMCDNSVCNRVQHSSCSKLCEEAKEQWFCDLCEMERLQSGSVQL